MATRTANLIRSLPYEGVVSYQDGFQVRSWDLATIQTNQVTFLTNFAATVAQLREIAEQELRQEQLTSAQLQFIDGLMQAPAEYYSPVRDYGGWYPRLFYRNVFGRTGSTPDAYSENYGVKKSTPSWPMCIPTHRIHWVGRSGQRVAPGRRPRPSVVHCRGQWDESNDVCWAHPQPLRIRNAVPPPHN